MKLIIETNTRYYIMTTPCGYYVDASDLTVIFKGYITGPKQPDSGFKISSGQDISQIFQPAIYPEERIDYPTNYSSTLSGTQPLNDLNYYFMNINYIFPTITPTGYTSFYNFTADNVTYQAAWFDGYTAPYNNTINGSLELVNVPSAGYTINYLLVGGGGGGGSGSGIGSTTNWGGAGGGGGGGDITCSSTTLSNGTYSITVPGKVDGGPGPANGGGSSNGNTGGTTIFDSFSAGGGGGGGGSGDGSGEGGGPGSSNTSPGGNAAQYGQEKTGKTFTGVPGVTPTNLHIVQSVLTVSCEVFYFYNSSSQDISYNILGGGGGGSASTDEVIGGLGAGGAGGNQPNIISGGSGNGFDGGGATQNGWGGGAGGGGCQADNLPYNAGGGGRGGPGLAVIWWEVPR
jgi:hypothetical protein